MFFVTVGTHEQQFNRLLEEIDKLKGDGVIEDEVFIQTGFSDYEPRYCQWKKMLTYEEMEHYIDSADVVITHGGPSTFMGVFASRKIPIVVPRQQKHEEHVNDHQLEFAYKLRDRYSYFPIVDKIEELESAIQESLSTTSEFVSHNHEFCRGLSQLIEEL